MAHQAPLSMGFSRQECWSGVPLPSPINCTKKVINAQNSSLANYFIFHSLSMPWRLFTSFFFCLVELFHKGAHPFSVFSDVMLVVWNVLEQDYFHHRNQQTLQNGAPAWGCLLTFSSIPLERNPESIQTGWRRNKPNDFVHSSNAAYWSPTMCNIHVMTISSWLAVTVSSVKADWLSDLGAKVQVKTLKVPSIEHLPFKCILMISRSCAVEAPTHS